MRHFLRVVCFRWQLNTLEWLESTFSWAVFTSMSRQGVMWCPKVTWTYISQWQSLPRTEIITFFGDHYLPCAYHLQFRARVITDLVVYHVNRGEYRSKTSERASNAAFALLRHEHIHVRRAQYWFCWMAKGWFVPCRQLRRDWAFDSFQKWGPKKRYRF